MSKNDLQRLLQYLDEQGYIEYTRCFDKAMPVQHFAFELEGKHYSIESVFLNDLFDPDIGEEELDIHFYFIINNIHCELIWQDQGPHWIIQSEQSEIRQHFIQLLFKQSGNNYYAGLESEQTLKFFIDNQFVVPEKIHLKSDCTPEDYSNIAQRIYIAIGKSKQTQISASQFIQALPDFIDEKTVEKHPYGFSLMLCTQQIPEVVIALVNQHFAIYQVCYTMGKGEFSYNESTKI